ncbi:protein of unknown function [Moritella yayanosii]|uniref:Uncharacterized protein n=1 Tax=Moritella yayanosii TaxID=69539 RepID=A0A330LPJ5_9GAMM|nr:protein of unknown function [Moritella yayanosii]
MTNNTQKNNDDDDLNGTLALDSTYNAKQYPFNFLVTLYYFALT